MANIELVIKIPESRYRLLQKQARTNLGREKLDEFAEVVLNGTPLDHVFNTIKDGIKEEADYAYADFEQYKADVLNAEADELPDDDFRYGMERAIEIINAYRKAVNE